MSIAIGVIALMASSAAAIAPGDAAPCDRFGTNRAVLVGLAEAPVRRVFTDIAPDVEPLMLVTPVVVDRSYRGANVAVVYLYFADGPGLETGRRYLVYGDYQGDSRELVTPTTLKTVEKAVEDLAFLDAVVSSHSGGIVYGTLEAGRLDDSSVSRAPLAGVSIRFESEAFSGQTVTAANGSFVMTGVPDGWVRLEPAVPAGWRVPPRAVEAHSGGCTKTWLVAELDGRIRGRVRHADGTPMTWMVDLVPAPGSVAIGTRPSNVRANADGEFEFVGVQPGSYLIGVNLRHENSGASFVYPPGSSTPYAPTYFPGVLNRGDAVPIVVGKGTVSERVDFVVRDAVPKP